jgi:hypothetical protein
VIGTRAFCMTRSVPSPRVQLGIAALFCLLVVLPFWHFRLVVPADRLGQDAARFFYPVYKWTAAQIAGGTFPLWNPYQLCGIPTLATLQGGLLYPPHALYLLLPTHVALSALGLLHLFLASSFMLIFCLRARLGMAPALLAATLVGIRGSQPGTLFNPAMQESSTWIGLGLIGVLELADGRLQRGSIVLALATSMSLLAGFPQQAAYSCYACAGLLAILLAFDADRRRHAVRAVLGLALGVGTGAMLAGVQLLPAFELAAEGARTRGTLSLEMMFPYGLHHYADLETAWRYVMRERFAEPRVLLGFGVTGLLLSAIALAHRRQRPLAIGAAVLTVSALLFALGPTTPFFDLYLLLPELGSFRRPLRIMSVADTGFAILAAVGLSLLLDVAARWQGKNARGGRPLLVPAVAIAVLAIAALELFLAPTRPYSLPTSTDHPYVAALSAPQPFHEALAAQPDRVWNIGVTNSSTMPWKAPSLFGIRSISDYEIMTLRRQTDFFSYLTFGRTRPTKDMGKGEQAAAFYGRVRVIGRGIESEGVVSRVRLAELAAARFVLATRASLREPAVERFVETAPLRATGLSGRYLKVLENPSALPRAYLVRGIQPARAAEVMLADMSRADFDPYTASYVEGELPPETVSEPATGAERVEIVEESLHRVTLAVSTTAPRLVVLSDSFYPGWQARIDGQPAMIHATNVLFRGVVVPAGTHELRFDYRPSSLRWGMLCSLTGLVGLGAIAWWGRRAGSAP